MAAAGATVLLGLLTVAGAVQLRSESGRDPSIAERLLAASEPSQETKDACVSLETRSGFTYCSKFLPRESADDQSKPPGFVFVGLSYGIGKRDRWSETMSNRYNVSTVLFDCYKLFGEKVENVLGPVTKDLHAKALGLDTCPPDYDGICYGAHYEAKPICASGRSMVVKGADKKSRHKFENIKEQLRTRSRMSSYLKIDIDGDEWGILRWLLDNEEQRDKFRGIDMVLNFDAPAAPPALMGPDKLLEYRVTLLEQLSEFMKPVGSTIQKELESQNPATGIPSHYTISYVHRSLIRGW